MLSACEARHLRPHQELLRILRLLLRSGRIPLLLLLLHLLLHLLLLQKLALLHLLHNLLRSAHLSVGWRYRLNLVGLLRRGWNGRHGLLLLLRRFRLIHDFVILIRLRLTLWLLRVHSSGGIGTAAAARCPSASAAMA